MAHCDTGSTHEGGKTSRYESKIIDWDVLHARIQEFLPGGGPGPTARKQHFLSPQLLQCRLSSIPSFS